MKLFWLVCCVLATAASAVPINVLKWYGSQYVAPEDLQAAAKASSIKNTGQTWVVTNMGQSLTMIVGSTHAVLNGNEINIDAPPRQINGKIYLPFSDLVRELKFTDFQAIQTVIATAPLGPAPVVPIVSAPLRVIEDENYTYYRVDKPFGIDYPNYLTTSNVQFRSPPESFDIYQTCLSLTSSEYGFRLSDIYKYVFQKPTVLEYTDEVTSVVLTVYTPTRGNLKVLCIGKKYNYFAKIYFGALKI